ncbi:Rv3235 family protein [Micromonospora sp. LOL_024]|uniref:Rv3235 family protein n=1 Tax=Micromonospora sp. LOL_024 TaxID=3345412 RepID=UPI003A885038
MTDLRRPGPAHPPVRLRPVPASDPPFVDEDTAGWPAKTDGQLALDLFAGNPRWSSERPSDRPPARWNATRTGRRAGAPGTPTADERRSLGRPTPAGPGDDAIRHLPLEALATATPAATRVAHRFVTTCLEVLNGFRPPVQLRQQLDPARSAQLLHELARAAARGVPARRRSTRPGLRLRRLRVCEPHSAAIEAAAVLTGAAGRSWALALRLEYRRGNWLCTDLRVL